MGELRDKNGLTEAEYMDQYEPGDFVRPSVAADMVIFTVTEGEEENYRKLPDKQLCVLLIRRGVHPYLGCWALPGGFVRPTETTEEAARRELYEETGIGEVYMEQLYTLSDPDRDPRTWVMSCSYMALIDSSSLFLKAGDDADDALWFQISYRLTEEHVDYGDLKTGQGKLAVRTKRYLLELKHEDIQLSTVIEKRITKTKTDTITDYKILENDGLAFDHGKILSIAVERLRGKIDYTDLALHLMPEEFTLTQLQQVYEVITDKTLLKAAFRRKIASLVVETDSYTKKEGHRPSRLYRKNMDI